MAENKVYRAVRAMSLPILRDGKSMDNGKEYLVRAGEDVEMLPDQAEAALRSGAVRELTDQEQAEREPQQPQEGSEVNGNPQISTQIPTDQAENGGKLPKPPANAKTEVWQAYAKQEGLDESGTRDEIRARVEAAEKLEAQ